MFLKRLESITNTLGSNLLTYGTAALLLWFGLFKFHPVEAAAIQPLVANSPLMSWMYNILSVQAVSNIIGASEIVTALLLLTRALPASTLTFRLYAIGGALGTFTFLTTLTFLVSTPGTFGTVPGFFLPVPAGPGGFLTKDFALLGAMLVAFGQGLSAINGSGMRVMRAAA